VGVSGGCGFNYSAGEAIRSFGRIMGKGLQKKILCPL